MVTKDLSFTVDNFHDKTFDTWWKLLPAAVKEMEEEIVCYRWWDSAGF